MRVFRGQWERARIHCGGDPGYFGVAVDKEGPSFDLFPRSFSCWELVGGCQASYEEAGTQLESMRPGHLSQ